MAPRAAKVVAEALKLRPTSVPRWSTSWSVASMKATILEDGDRARLHAALRQSDEEFKAGLGHSGGRSPRPPPSALVRAPPSRRVSPAAVRHAERIHDWWVENVRRRPACSDARSRSPSASSPARPRPDASTMAARSRRCAACSYRARATTSISPSSNPRASCACMPCGTRPAAPDLGETSVHG